MAYQDIPPSSTAADYDGWRNRWSNFIRSKVPQLNAFEYQKLGQYDLGAIGTGTGSAATASMVGGGIIGTAASYTVLGTDIYQNGKTFFGFNFEGIIAVTATTKSATLGLTNLAASTFLGARSEFDVDATHYILRAAGSNSIGTVVNDGLIHNFTVTGNATTVMLWIDGASYGGAGIAQSGITTEALSACIQNTTAGDGKASRFLYGYVHP